MKRLSCNEPSRSCARDLVIARLTMHHGTVLGDANKKPVPQNSPVMHCQPRYSQASIAQLWNGELGKRIELY